MGLVFEVHGRFSSTASDETLLPRGCLFQVSRGLPRFFRTLAQMAATTLQPVCLSIAQASR